MEPRFQGEFARSGVELTQGVGSITIYFTTGIPFRIGQLQFGLHALFQALKHGIPTS